MTQDKSYKYQMRLVDNNLIGPLERLNNLDGFHPMVRHSWGNCVDRLRGVLGNYNTVYEGSRGKMMWSYSNPGNAWDHSSRNLGRLHLQTENIVLRILNEGEIRKAPRAEQYSPVLNIAGDEGAWNAFENKSNASAGFLAWPTPQPPPIMARNLYQYIHGRFEKAGEWYDGLINEIEVTASGHGAVKDYTSFVYGVPGDKNLRNAAGSSLDIISEYNYYADTSPNYESVISPPAISENSLPNMYILQSELRNTGSLLLAEFHQTDLTLGGSLPYFISTLTTITERNIGETYQLWAAALVKPPSPAIGGSMEANNTNFVVLHTDEGLLNEGYVEGEMVPFCMKLVIPPDPDAVGGSIKGGLGNSLLKRLANDKDTKDFIDILQVAAINTMLGLGSAQPPGPATFRFTQREAQGVKKPNHNYQTTTVTVPVLVDLKEAFSDYAASRRPGSVELVPNSLEEALKCINNYSTPALPPAATDASYINPPYRFLKDYRRTGFNGARKLVAKGGHIENAQVEIEEKIESFCRTYMEVLDNKWSHTETLMYVVNKYELTDEDSRGSLLQTFYFSNKFDYKNAHLPLTFCDSQVKYEKKYRYEINQVVAIFGNEYSYEDKSKDTPTTPIEARIKFIKVHNSYNIRLVLLPYLMPNGIDAMIVDSPPVAPDVSFYPHRGVNNRLQVLLNAGTGRQSLKPVVIQSTDRNFFEKEYLAQEGVALTFDQIQEQGKKIRFESDDPVDAYQLFRVDTPPESYAAFTDKHILSPDLNPTYGTPASHIDTIVPNKKYYYCARAIDVHGNISNPSTIIEIEMIDNNGQIFLRQKVFSIDPVKQTLTTNARRFILIEPAGWQKAYDPLIQGGPMQSPELGLKPVVPLGASHLQDSLWEKKFKLRLVSKQTGRKLDLNITFKNSGIVK
jgi:hypothetical protein